MTHPGLDSVIVFALDEVRFALGLGAVTRIVQAVEITPLPDAPGSVRGVVNVGGRIVPVFDLRPRFGLEPRTLRLADHLVIARTSRRMVAVIVDHAMDVVGRAEMAVTPASALLPRFDAIEGVAIHAGDIVVIQDLERFLSSEDHDILDKALTP